MTQAATRPASIRPTAVEMVRTLPKWLPALALAGAVCLGATPAKAQDNRDSYANLVASLWPAVVNISVTTAVPAGPPKAGQAEAVTRDVSFAGSGFIIDPSGYIVTNRHVVINAYSIMVTLSDGTRLAADVIGHPPATDIALLKVAAPHALPVVAFGDSEVVRVGDKVLAIGNPLGFGETVTAGIVSALNRNTGESPYDNFIQTDAAINHGNSGGPMFNLQGKVIGVNTEIVTPNAQSTGSIGLGLAIPSDDVRFAVTELRKYGRVRPGWIGARLQEITPDLSTAFDLPGPEGALVAAVDHGGPAESAGLRPGDVIRTFDGRTPADVRALMRMIAESPLGGEATLAVRRGHSDRAVNVVINEYPPAKMVADFPFQLTNPPRLATADTGIRVATMTNAMRRRFNLPASTAGVEVADVLPGSPADRAGLQRGDVILQVQDQAADSPEVVETALHLARERTRGEIALLVAGPGWQTWLPIPLPPNPRNN
jgi:serine protease Do